MRKVIVTYGRWWANTGRKDRDSLFGGSLAAVHRVRRPLESEFGGRRRWIVDRGSSRSVVPAGPSRSTDRTKVTRVVATRR